jgi:hypothetical protein
MNENIISAVYLKIFLYILLSSSNKNDYYISNMYDKELCCFSYI